MKVLTALDFDIGVRVAVPYLQLLPPMVVGQIRVRANMLDEPLRILPELPVLRRVPPERREPLMLEDIRRDEVEENGEEEEDNLLGPPPDAVESDEKSDEDEYVLV